MLHLAFSRVKQTRVEISANAFIDAPKRRMKTRKFIASQRGLTFHPSRFHPSARSPNYAHASIVKKKYCLLHGPRWGWLRKESNWFLTEEFSFGVGSLDQHWFRTFKDLVRKGREKLGLGYMPEEKDKKVVYKPGNRLSWIQNEQNE